MFLYSIHKGLNLVSYRVMINNAANSSCRSSFSSFPSLGASFNRAPDVLPLFPFITSIENGVGDNLDAPFEEKGRKNGPNHESRGPSKDRVVRKGHESGHSSRAGLEK